MHGGGRAVERAGFDPSEPRDPHGKWTSGASSSDYSDSSPSKAEKDDHVEAVYSLNAKGKEAAEKSRRTPLTFHALTADGNKRFHAAITTAKAGLKYGASVHAYDADEYRNVRMFVTPDNKAGFAVKADGDIVSAFSSKSGVNRAGDSILALAVQQGGRKLDAFDTVLPGIYGDNGFRAVARLAWNDEYKPDDWNYDTFKKFNNGRPDVVFMVHDPAHARAYDPNDGTRVQSYDEGVALQARALEEIKSRTKAFDPGKHPHKPSGPGGGQWAPTGTGGSDGGRTHPGEGYSSGAWVDDEGVIHTNNVYDAQRALFEDRRVELKQPKQVSTLIKRLGETAAEMAEAGEKAPVFNLCNVSIEGTNLFCAQQKGIPRVEMPVIPAKRTKDFIKHLKSLGYEVEKDTEKAANLRATQSEIDGVKVATQMERIRKEGFYKRLVISKDDYILDGHHTWAGQLGLDAQDNKLSNDKEVKTARVNIGITKLIEIAEKWTQMEGIAKKPAGQRGFIRMTLREAASALDPATFRKYYEAARTFFAANPHVECSPDNIVITLRAPPEADGSKKN